MNPLPTTPTNRLALFGALLASFDALHPLCDQWVQSSKDAAAKGLHGTELVYRDGTPVAENPWHHGPTRTASSHGRRAVARHVASYSAVQLAAGVGVTRAFGVRVPVKALLAGAVINAGTHAILDRRDPLIWLAERAGKGGYIKHATVVRKPGHDAAELSGPGTALLELDQAAHRGFGFLAAAVTTWYATRPRSAR